MTRTLQEMSWVQAEKALAATTFAIVPVGAVEVYGPHLPMGSDGLVALEASRRLADRTGAVVAPLVPIGCSQSLMSFPGTLSVEPESLKMYLRDVCSSLVFYGIKRILFMNGHAGNVTLIGELCREFGAKGIQCAQVDWWRAIGRVAVGIADTGDVAVGHAGENCTSVVMAVRPDLVDMSLATKEKANSGLVGKYPEIMQYDRPYREITSSGMTGDATTATNEKGEAMIGRFLDKAEAFLKEWK
jgi:creatinine amidohydrolase